MENRIEKLISIFHKFPGVGPKMAQRMAYNILKWSDDEIKEFISILGDIKNKTRFCSVCFNITETDPCRICSDTKRDRTIICIVENVVDLQAIENSKSYNGLYHVLGGAISPLDGVNIADLKIEKFLKRLKNGKPSEIIVATNPSVEGEVTATYLSNIIKSLGVAVTRIGCGVPVGGEIEYADDITIKKSLESRTKI